MRSLKGTLQINNGKRVQMLIFSAFCISSVIVLFFPEQFKFYKDSSELQSDCNNVEAKNFVYDFYFFPFFQKIDFIKKSPIFYNLKSLSLMPEIEEKNTKEAVTSEKAPPAENHLIENQIAVADVKNRIQPINSSKASNQNAFSLFGELLYFKVTEDSLDYAERIPQNSTFTPRVGTVSQHFIYQPGFRVGADYTFMPLELTAAWMCYYGHPPTVHASDNDFGLLATLAGPVWGDLGNSQVSKVSGKWHLKMDIIDLIVRRFFNFNELHFSPISGIKMGVIKQKIDVHYQNFLIEFPADVSPAIVIGKSNFWCIGPTLGIELKYGLSKGFKMLFNGNFSCLVGKFNTKTLYFDFQPPGIAPPDSEIKIVNSETRLSTVEQLQAGFEKKWEFKKSSFEIAFLYEFQIWQNQMRLNYFSSFVTPPSEADLSLYGPVFRARIDF